MNCEWISQEKIAIDWDVNRREMDTEHIHSLAKHMNEDGFDEKHPIIIYEIMDDAFLNYVKSDHNEFVVAAGHHRLAASRIENDEFPNLPLREVYCEVKQGTHDEFILQMLTDNLRHVPGFNSNVGKMPSRLELHAMRVWLMMFPHLFEKSDRVLGAELGCSYKTIGRLRDELIGKIKHGAYPFPKFVSEDKKDKIREIIENDMYLGSDGKKRRRSKSTVTNVSVDKDYAEEDNDESLVKQSDDEIKEEITLERARESYFEACYAVVKYLKDLGFDIEEDDRCVRFCDDVSTHLNIDRDLLHKHYSDIHTSEGEFTVQELQTWRAHSETILIALQEKPEWVRRMIAMERISREVREVDVDTDDEEIRRKLANHLIINWSFDKLDKQQLIEEYSISEEVLQILIDKEYKKAYEKIKEQHFNARNDLALAFSKDRQLSLNVEMKTFSQCIKDRYELRQDIFSESKSDYKSDLRTIKKEIKPLLDAAESIREKADWVLELLPNKEYVDAKRDKEQEEDTPDEPETELPLQEALDEMKAEADADVNRKLVSVSITWQDGDNIDEQKTIHFINNTYDARTRSLLMLPQNILENLLTIAIPEAKINDEAGWEAPYQLEDRKFFNQAFKSWKTRHADQLDDFDFEVTGELMCKAYQLKMRNLRTNVILQNDYRNTYLSMNDNDDRLLEGLREL